MIDASEAAEERREAEEQAGEGVGVGGGAGGKTVALALAADADAAASSSNSSSSPSSSSFSAATSLLLSTRATTRNLPDSSLSPSSAAETDLLSTVTPAAGAASKRAATRAESSRSVPE